MAPAPAAVPLIVHQTAPADRRRWDPRWEPCQETWQAVCPAPEYRHILWDDPGLRSLVAEAFPEFLDTYDGYEQHIQRVDFARAAMLHIHGGLYVDMDVEVRRSPFPYLRPGMVSIVGSPYPKNERHQNSMMASPPGHPFWRSLAQEAVRRHNLPGQYRTTWQLTGPQLLDAVVDLCPQDVHVLPASEFNPAAQSPLFNSPDVLTRHFCTSVWTHSMDIHGMRLYQAVRVGDQAGVAAAVRAGADLESRDYAGLAPMHHAALRGDPSMVGLLASLKADINAEDKNDTMPLHYAVQVSCAPAVQRLLECRASTSGRLREGPAAGCTPLHLAQSAFQQAGCSLLSPVGEVLRLLDPAMAPAPKPAVQHKKKQKDSGGERPWWAAAAASSSAALAAPSTQAGDEGGPSMPLAAQLAERPKVLQRSRGRQGQSFWCGVHAQSHQGWGCRRLPRPS